jgi:hypothetical protein
MAVNYNAYTSLELATGYDQYNVYSQSDTLAIDAMVYLPLLEEYSIQIKSCQEPDICE